MHASCDEAHSVWRVLDTDQSIGLDSDANALFDFTEIKGYVSDEMINSTHYL